MPKKTLPFIFQQFNAEKHYADILILQLKLIKLKLFIIYNRLLLIFRTKNNSQEINGELKNRTGRQNGKQNIWLKSVN